MLKLITYPNILSACDVEAQKILMGTRDLSAYLYPISSTVDPY